MRDKGIAIIGQEREKQLSKGFTATHDFQHDNGQLIRAAMFALTEDEKYSQKGFEDFEWNVEGDRHTVENLAKAGALIAAEIDRILMFYQKE